MDRQVSEGDGERQASADGVQTKQSPPMLLEMLAARVPEPVVVTGETTTLLTGNERLSELLDRPLSTLLGEPLQAVFPGATPDAVDANCDADGEAYVTSQYERADADGWVELVFERHRWEGDEYVLGIVHEVTERRRRKQKLEQYERILETIEDGVYSLDESFTIETVNSAVESMTGHSTEHLIGANATLLADDETIEAATELLRDLRAGDRDVGTLTTELETAEGGSIPVETRFTSHQLADGSYRHVGVVRDISTRKRFEETLAALHDATRELLRAETKADVAAHIVETATEMLGLPDASVYRFDQSTNLLRPAAVADAATAVPVDEGLLWDVFLADEQVAYAPAEDVTLGGGRSAGETGGVCLPLNDYGVFHVGLPEKDTTRVRELVDLLAASTQAALARVDREMALRDREAERREQNEELRQLTQINALIRRIDRALVDAETVEAIETAVCEQLGRSQWFSFAWIGRQDDESLTPRAWTGESVSYLDDISLSVAGEDGPPAVRTTRTGSMTVVPAIGDGLRREAWRTAAVAREFQSALSVPLQYDDYVYGVLTVYAADQSVMGEMVQSVFAELGETIANAMREVESRQRRTADSVTELSLSCTAPESPARRLAERLDAPVDCEGAVPDGETGVRLFLTVPEHDGETVQKALEGMVGVESATVVSEMGTVETLVTGPTVARTLVEQTTNMVSMRATARKVEATVHLGGAVDVRSFVERLRRSYPETQLRARRTRSAAYRSHSGTRAALADRLTDRQWEVLRTAYLSGFFEWPRETTGEEVAAILDVSQPTVNRHLRVGERKLLDILFDGV